MSKENGWFSLESSDDPPEDPTIPDYDPAISTSHTITTGKLQKENLT